MLSLGFLNSRLSSLMLCSWCLLTRRVTRSIRCNPRRRGSRQLTSAPDRTIKSSREVRSLFPLSLAIIIHHSALHLAMACHTIYSSYSFYSLSLAKPLFFFPSNLSLTLTVCFSPTSFSLPPPLLSQFLFKEADEK